jgi:hypothetical protein
MQNRRQPGHLDSNGLQRRLPAQLGKPPLEEHKHVLILGDRLGMVALPDQCDAPQDDIPDDLVSRAAISGAAA